MKPTHADSEIVAEVRQRAGEISREFNDDVRAYVEHLKQYQKRYADRLVSQVTVVRPAHPENGGQSRA